MIDKSDIPRGWIGLETDRDGNRMYRVHITSSYDCIHPQKPGNVTDLIARVAIRRDHRTRYAAMKAFVKARRSREKEYKKEYTVTSAISNIVDYLKGSVMFENCTSIVEVLNRRGIHIPDYLSDKVSWLEQFKQGKRT